MTGTVAQSKRRRDAEAHNASGRGNLPVIHTAYTFTDAGAAKHASNRSNDIKELIMPSATFAFVLTHEKC